MNIEQWLDKHWCEPLTDEMADELEPEEWDCRWPELELYTGNIIGICDCSGNPKPAAIHNSCKYVVTYEEFEYRLVGEKMTDEIYRKLHEFDVYNDVRAKVDENGIITSVYDYMEPY